MLTTKTAGGSYEANYENLEYTLHVFYELNYFMDKLRFVGDDPLAYGRFVDIVKVVLREMPKIKHIEIVTNGNIMPDESVIDVPSIIHAVIVALQPKFSARYAFQSKTSSTALMATSIISSSGSLVVRF